MSQWSASLSQRAARAQPPVREPHPSASRPSTTAYTIALTGRQIRFRPVAFWIAVGTVVILAGWSITTATYFAFSDDVIKGILAREAAQQYAYEDRIAELRAQIDRTTSRQLLDQEQFEKKLELLLRREATLESRAMTLGGVAEPETTGSLRPALGETSAGGKSDPIGDMTLQPGRDHSGQRPDKHADIGVKLQYIEASLDRIEHRQTAALDQIQQHYEGKARKMRSILAELGIKLDTNPPASGGPFVPVTLPSQSHAFERALIHVNIARAYADDLGAKLAAVPLRLPVTGDIEISSPFGVRVDPFLHIAAMHTGMDFRGPYGEPIHATAAGTVATAGWSGGYGQMVEIDHGNGLATRYGHLSEIDVVVGQTVRIGQVIGRLGSTGRSTGPHLHYETRIDGEAVNPEKFLAAGAKLFGEQQPPMRFGRSQVQD